MALKIILVDFKRTLYNPDAKEMYPDWEAVLKLKNFGLEVWLWSRDEFEGTERELRHKIKEKFDQAIISNDKDLRQVEKPAESCVITDHKLDIEMAQKVGSRTIWLKQGRYKDYCPERRPDAIVFSLNEAIMVIEDWMKNKEDGEIHVS